MRAEAQLARAVARNQPVKLAAMAASLMRAVHDVQALQEVGQRGCCTPYETELRHRDGHTVFAARNGLLALQMVQNRTFNLILLSVMLPDANGYQVLEHLLGQRPRRLHRQLLCARQHSFRILLHGFGQRGHGG